MNICQVRFQVHLLANKNIFFIHISIAEKTITGKQTIN